jgi:hypothetical protein
VGGVEEAGAELGVDGVRVDSLFFFFLHTIHYRDLLVSSIGTLRPPHGYINGTQGRRLAGNS